MRHRQLLVLVTLLPFIWVNAQLNYRFRNLSISEGLSQSSVMTVIQDNIGTMWIGTQDGLNRYDGHQFEVFTSDDTEGLESEYILSSYKDRNGNLWFGTGNGLTLYDPLKETFKTFSVGKNTPLSVECIEEDEVGNLWLGTTTLGLARWDKMKQTISLIKTGIPTKNIPYVKRISAKTLLLSSDGNGVYLFNYITGKIEHLNGPKISTKNWLINDAEIISDNSILLSSNEGIWNFNPTSKKFVPFLPKIQTDLNISEIVDILISKDNTYYIATKNKGLITAIRDGKEWNIYQSHQDIFQKNALLFDELSSIYEDVNGAVWVGTLRGISCFDPINQGFLGIGPSGNLAQGLPAASVWSFDEDPKHNFLFVATDRAVSKLNRKTGEFTHYDISKNDKKLELRILVVHSISEHEMLVGSTNGLYLLNYSATGYNFERCEFKGLKNPNNFDRIYSIVPYKKDQYLLGCKSGALLYNYKTKETQAFVHSSKYTKTTIGGGVCRVIYKGLDATYFGPSTGGIYVLKEADKGAKTIVPFQYNEKLARFTKDYISSIIQTSPTELWVGTTGSGIFSIQLKTGQIQQFTRQNGLPNNFVYGILPDKDGNLWISTNKGLSVFNLAQKTFKNYTEVNGLKSNEFNTGAFLASKTGELFFGGISGYNYFKPDHLTALRSNLHVTFTKFKLDDKWIKPTDLYAPFKESISRIGSIVLSYKQRSFSIRFVASELVNPELLEFKYRLEGSEEADVFLGTSNEIRFNALSPGNYTLKVFVRRSDGNWNTDPATLQIEVEYPYWKKWWFILTVAIMIVIMFIMYLRRRTELARREQIRLEMKIVERTKEIRAQNQKIELQKQIIEEEKNKVEEQKRLLQIEKDKSEKLLNNIIPEATAQELKNKGRASARAYKTVSVLFTDFVGFTKIAERMKPTELVNKLDIYFRKFDEIIVRNNLEKIKTIGDAYMCAGGVPVRNNSNPIDSVLAALQIQEYMHALKNDAIANGTEYWELRLGINTGEVTAGVIGSERLAYDIWGSTVNQAQRMEMMGEPGRVTISGATFNLIEPYFECTFRGKVQSKSKGMIEMFTVERIKPELSVNGEGIYPNERFQQIVNLHLYSSINYYKAERHIMKVLEKGLSPKLHYHSIAHTKDVVKAVEHYALLEGVTDEGLFLLKSAATYHDAGFVESYEKNEPIGARMAEEILPKYGYSTQHIDQIKELIFVTQIPHNPKNHLEQIICDADLDYLGRDDFHEIADKLRLELREHGKIDSDRKWDQMQVSFLNMHKYFTQTAINSRQEKKMQNLKEVMDRLERDEYVD